MSTTGPMAPHHRRVVATVISTTLLVLALATGSLVSVFYERLDANLHTGQAIKHLRHKRQTGPKSPLNILVMGLDTRDCAGCHIDNEPGGDGSDTTILLHISADRRTVYGVSIPRDALVAPVGCTAKSTYGSTGLVQWNAAFAAGGAECTAEQVEKNFGVYVDDYVTINFGGFKDMVDAIGGVDICIPFELKDPVYEHVDFKPGPAVHLDGTNALKYVRLRHVLDGSDIGRMKRQQAFISAMINKVISAGTLTRPDRVYAFANALTKSMTTSPDLGHVKDLVKLAEQLKNTSLGDIRFVTVPSQPYDVPRNDPRWGRVQILPAAAQLWKRINADKPLSKALSASALSAGTASAGASPSSAHASRSASSGTSGSSTSASAQSTPSTSTAAASEAARSGLCS